jgi:hypothetical protein
MYETLLSMPNLRQKASPLQRPLDPWATFGQHLTS